VKSLAKLIVSYQERSRQKKHLFPCTSVSLLPSSPPIYRLCPSGLMLDMTDDYSYVVPSTAWFVRNKSTEYRQYSRSRRTHCTQYPRTHQHDRASTPDLPIVLRLLPAGCRSQFAVRRFAIQPGMYLSSTYLKFCWFPCSECTAFSTTIRSSPSAPPLILLIFAYVSSGMGCIRAQCLTTTRRSRRFIAALSINQKLRRGHCIR